MPYQLSLNRNQSNAEANHNQIAERKSLANSYKEVSAFIAISDPNCSGNLFATPNQAISHQEPNAQVEPVGPFLREQENVEKILSNSVSGKPDPNAEFLNRYENVKLMKIS